MNNQAYSEITETIITKAQADDFILQLDNFTDSIFDIKEDVNTKLSRFLSFDKKNKIISICQKNNIRLDDLDSLQKLVADLKDFIKKLPVVDIQVAFELNDVNVNNISAWFSFKLKQKILANITINPKLIAGAIIGFNGIYKDCTLKKKLEDKFEKGELILH